MADAAIRAEENLDPDAGEDPAQVNTLRNVLVSDATGPFTVDRKAVVRFAGVPEGDTFRRGRRDRTDEDWPRCWPEAGSRVPAAAGGGCTPPRSAWRPTRPLSGHGDLGGHNRIVRQPAGRWVLAVVVDWECGSPVFHSPTSDTSCGMSEAAGRPWSRIFEPAAWRAAAGCRRSGGASRASSISSRSARCRRRKGYPTRAAAELVGLIRATVDSRLLTASRS